MADYPCDLHLARYKGPSTRCFLNLYRDDMACFFRVSVCEECVDELVKPWLERGLTKTDAGHWDPLEGNEELQGLWQAQERAPSARNGYSRH